jgi:hypothetical protein
MVEALGQWGPRWVPELGDEDYDPHLLMWDLHRNGDLDAVPPGRTVLHFTFSDVAPEERNWWVVIDSEGVDLCQFDPGHPVTGTVETDLRTLTRIWRGELTWPQSQRTGALHVQGPSHVARPAALAAQGNHHGDPTQRLTSDAPSPGGGTRTPSSRATKARGPITSP